MRYFFFEIYIAKERKLCVKSGVGCLKMWITICYHLFILIVSTVVIDVFVELMLKSEDR